MNVATDAESVVKPVHICPQKAHLTRQNSSHTTQVACVHHASRLFEPREKTHHACPHLPEKRIRCRLACRPGHFFRPCVGVESQPVLLERKHRRDEMRGGKKLEKCNQRDFTFCQVGNLKVHQKQPTGSLIFFDPRYFGLLTPRA